MSLKNLRDLIVKRKKKKKLLRAFVLVEWLAFLFYIWSVTALGTEEFFKPIRFALSASFYIGGVGTKCEWTQI